MAFYTYSVAEDFSNHWVCPETFEAEIRASEIVSVYLYCVISGDDCIPYFSAALSETDKGILDAIVAAHTGQPPAPTPQEVSIIGDSDVNILRVAVQAAAIPTAATEFCLGVRSEMEPTGEPPTDTSETESDALPLGKTLHVLFARATCPPKVDSSNVRAYLLVELIWREEIDEEIFDHIFGVSYLDIHCSADFPASSVCFDGTPMVGDGATTKFVIRRTAFGDVDTLDACVIVRGYHA